MSPLVRYSPGMSNVARRKATYEDILAAPPNQVAQVIDGELYLHPRPAQRHARSASALGAKLLSHFDEGPNGEGGDWVVIYEPELHFGADILVPDLAAWRVERYPGGDDSDEPFFTVAPDWVCEVLSTSTARTDRIKKIPVYAREGVPYVWLVDPRDRTIEVLRLRDGGYQLLGSWGGDEGPFTLEPFDALPLAPSAFWGRRLGR